jgi:hypothetical protein
MPSKVPSRFLKRLQIRALLDWSHLDLSAIFCLFCFQICVVTNLSAPSCFCLCSFCCWGEVSTNWILNNIGRNFLLGSRKEKELSQIFNEDFYLPSTFLNDPNISGRKMKIKNGLTRSLSRWNIIPCTRVGPPPSERRIDGEMSWNKIYYKSSTLGKKFIKLRSKYGKLTKNFEKHRCTC